VKEKKEQRLSSTSIENLRIADAVGFDQAEAGVLVYVEKNGNRAYLHTKDGPACFKSVAEARAAVTRHRPDLAKSPGPRRSSGPGR
jgi:hypothetical protein